MVITSNLIQAVDLLRAGGLVAFPTETVYGLGADATNEAAVRKVFRVKERPFDHPLIVHLAHQDQLDEWAKEVSPYAAILARRFWPGPLTLVLNKRASVLALVAGGQETVGVRVPRHPIAQQLLQAFGGGLVAPSANRFTHISPTTAEAVAEELNGRIDLILEGGPCEVGLESTIVDLSRDMPAILRPGMITTEAIAKALQLSPDEIRQQQPDIRAPGMHHLHYAPTTRTTLVETKHTRRLLQDLKAEDLPVALITYREADFPLQASIQLIKMPSDPVAYAHDLYHTLRSLDQQLFNRLIIEAVPEGAEWAGIRDRLGKASHER